MFPTYDQQHPSGYPYGMQHPQRHGYGFPSTVFGPNNQAMNWSGGVVNGQQMPFPLAPPPPFYYPFDASSSWNNDQSRYSRKNGKRSYDNRKRSVTPRRGNQQNNRQRNTPKQRRLDDFMPETWRNLNQINLPDNRRQSKTTPDQMNNSKNNNVQFKKETSDKVRLNTLRRRERRQRNRAFLPNRRNEELGRLEDNRFNTLSRNNDDTETDNSEAETDHNNRTRAMNKKESSEKPNSNIRKNNVVAKQTNTTNGVKLSKTRKNQRQNHASDDDFPTENDTDRSNDEVSSRSTNDKRKLKLYLQDYKILSYLKTKISSDRKLKDLKDSLNEIYKYAKDTLPTYDKWVYNQYEAQVWQHFYELGKNKDHWAKEIVDKTHTRDDKRNLSLCENKISQFTSACIDANDIITRALERFFPNQNTSAAVNASKKVHDLMLDYIKESTTGLMKMSSIRIRRASLEKDEWTALKAFENMATEQQKIYAKTFCRPAIKAYQKKKKNFELVAAHISYDIIPKNLPQYDFSLPMDESSQSADEILKNKKNIEELSRDFRIKATQLYLKVAKGEYDFQNERLDRLLKDFPPDTYDVPLTQAQAAAVDDNKVENDDDDDDDDDGNDDENHRGLTQRVRIQVDPNNVNIIGSKGSDMFTEYVEISYKRAVLEIEREVLFLDERSVKQTPFEIQDARKMNPVLRKDFVLQV